MVRKDVDARKRPTSRDKAAGDLIRRLRNDQGLSRRDLSVAVEQKGVAAGYDRARVSVSPDTIYLIERSGREPGPRIKFALALYFDLRPGQIWKRDALAGHALGHLGVAA